MYETTERAVTPFTVKRVIGSFYQKFQGFAQHDAMELITVVLDFLHEDLNRITDKPYIETEDYLEE